MGSNRFCLLQMEQLLGMGQSWGNVQVAIVTTGAFQQELAMYAVSYLVWLKVVTYCLQRQFVMQILQQSELKTLLQIKLQNVYRVQNRVNILSITQSNEMKNSNYP